MFLIEKTIFDIQAKGKIDGFQLQNDLSRWFYKELLPDVEILFNQYDSKENTIEIPKLEVEINTFDIENLTALKAQLLTALEEALKQSKIKTITSNQYNINTNNNTQNANNELVIYKNNIKNTYFNLWLHFMEHGTMPSSSLAIEEDKMLLAVAEIIALDANAEGRVRYLFSQKKEAIQRFIYQHEEPFLSRILGVFLRQKLSMLSTWRKAILTQIARSKSSKIFTDEYKATIEKAEQQYSKTKFWTIIFEKILIQNNTVSNAETLFFMPLEMLIAQEAQTSKQQLNTRDFETNFYAQIIENQWFENNFSSGKILEKYLNKKYAAHKKTSKVSKKTIAENAISKEKESPINDDIKRKFETQNPENQYYIKNAGIVIVHAFLPSFYENIGLLNPQKQFLDEHAQQCAIQWIEHLATGEEQLPEYRLLLSKILCGLPLDIPLERDIIFSDNDKTEAQNLLEAIIEHWTIIGKTSIESLRQTFFHRDGKLSHDDKGWLLQVEQRTEDILLSRLPWGISMIKLPFMKEMLRVEWI